MSFSLFLLESFYFPFYLPPPSVWPYISLRRFAVRTVLACSSFSLVPRIPKLCLSFFTGYLPPSLTPYPPPYTPSCHPDPFLCLTLGPPSSSHASRQGDAVSVRCSVLLAPSVGFVESQPAPVARSAGIRGIFEPVHDGRLRQGRTFLPDASKILWKIVARKCFRFDWKLADWIGKV